VTPDGYKRVAFAADDKLLLLWAANEVEIVEAGPGARSTGSHTAATSRCTRRAKTRGSRRRGAVLDITRPSSRDYLWPDDQLSELRFSRDGGTLIGVGRTRSCCRERNASASTRS